MITLLFHHGNRIPPSGPATFCRAMLFLMLAAMFFPVPPISIGLLIWGGLSLRRDLAEVRQIKAKRRG